MVQVTAKVRDVLPGGVKDAVLRSVEPAIRDGLRSAGKEMVNIANALMAGDFDLNRPYERRRHPGSRRASNALDFVVEGGPENYTLGFRVLGGTEVFKRILGMNYGTPPHEIYPSGNWSLRGAQIYSRATRGSNATRSGSGEIALLAWVDAATGDVVTPNSVSHPGTKGSGFIEEAQQAIIARIGTFI